MQERPFIIWSMRRTGGTTLMDFLAAQSAFPRAQHEPFNLDRTFGWVAKEWFEHKDPEALNTSTKRVLHKKPVIKHCYELHPQIINDTILETTTRKDYAHVVLDRLSETDRILSLELAAITGAWGKMGSEDKYKNFRAGTEKMPEIDVAKAVQHMENCQVDRQKLSQAFTAAGVEPFVIYFEDVYRDHEAGKRNVASLMSHVGIDTSTSETYERDLDNALQFKGQNSASMLDYVPNIDELRSRLSETAARLPKVFASSVAEAAR